MGRIINFEKLAESLVSLIMEQKTDKNFKNIGAEKFFSSEELVRKFSYNLLSMAPHYLKGYQYDYLHYHLENDIEFMLCVDAGDEEITHAIGFNMHYCSNSLNHIDCNEIIAENNGSALCRLETINSEKEFTAKIICSDILPELDGRLFVQAVAYPQKAAVYENEDRWIREAHTDDCALGKIEDLGDTIKTAVEVTDCIEHIFTAEDFESRYYEITGYCDLGELTIIVAKDMLGEVPNEGKILEMETSISCDVGLHEHKNGIVESRPNTLRLMRSCILRNDYNRLKRIMTDGNNIITTGSDWNDAVRLRLKHVSEYSDLYFDILDIKETDPEYEQFSQKQAIFAIDKEANPIAAILLDMDEDGRLKDIIETAPESIIPVEELSEDDYFILDALRYVGASKVEAEGVMIQLEDTSDEEDEDDSNPSLVEERKKQLAEYIRLKGRYITQQDISQKTAQICRDREQYYPWNKFVRYIGNSNKELTNGNIYRVDVVFGIDEIFLLINDQDEQREYESSLFENLRVTEIIYRGNQEHSGEAKVTKGFVIGETYKVITTWTAEYWCNNGRKCFMGEAVPSKFENEVIVDPCAYRSVDEALHDLRNAFEFGQLKELAEHLPPACAYVSQSGKKFFSSKDQILAHFKRVAKVQLSNHIYLDCAFGTVSESGEYNKFPVGTRCMPVFEKDGCKDVAFVRLSDDKKYIVGIYLLNEQYTFTIDDSKSSEADPMYCDKVCLPASETDNETKYFEFRRGTDTSVPQHKAEDSLYIPKETFVNLGLEGLFRLVIPTFDIRDNIAINKCQWEFLKTSIGAKRRVCKNVIESLDAWAEKNFETYSEFVFIGIG